MAGFAVDIGDAGAEYAQGVSAPSATSASAAAQGLNTLGRGVFGTMDAYDRAVRAAKPTEASINRQGFASFISGLDELKGVTDPVAIRANVNSLVGQYEAQGFQIGQAEADAVRRRTGIDLTTMIGDPAQAAFDANIKKLTDNPSYLYLAEQKLLETGQPYTQQQILETALGSMQSAEASALYLTNAKITNRREYFEQFVPQANATLENIRGTAMAGLKVEIAGGDISPESITQLRTQFDIAKAQITKPASISGEDWQGVQAQLDTLDSLLTSLETYDERQLAKTKAEILEPISKVLMAQAKELTATDPILAQALLSDKVDWSTYVSQNYPDLLKTIDNIEVEDTVYTDLEVFEFAKPEPQEQPDGITVTPLPPVEELHDIDEVSKAEERSNTARSDAISFASTLRIHPTEPQNMELPEHRTNFLAGVGQATVNIATSPELLKQSTMANVYSDDTYTKLAIIKRLDPEAHDLAVERLKDGLASQFNIAATTASGSLQSSFFNISGLGEIEYDIERRTMEGAFRMGAEANALVLGFAGKHYNGDVTAMVADRGRRLSTFERSQIENEGFKFNVAYQDYRKVQKVSQNLKFYTDQLKKLGMDTASIEAALIKPVDVPDQEAKLGSLQNPFQIVWSDDTDVDEKLFASLNVGQYFINPEGDIEQKVR